MWDQEGWVYYSAVKKKQASTYDSPGFKTHSACFSSSSLSALSSENIDEASEMLISKLLSANMLKLEAHVSRTLFFLSVLGFFPHFAYFFLLILIMPIF